MTEVHVAICKLIYAYFATEIILKQLFTSVSVIIGEYSPRLRLGEYSPIITSTSVNNLLSIVVFLSSCNLKHSQTAQLIFLNESNSKIYGTPKQSLGK